MTEREKLFNELCNILLVNIYSKSKENQRIIFKNFDYDNLNHRLGLVVGLGVNAVFNFPIDIETGFFKFLKIKKDYKKLKFIKRIRHTDDAAAIDLSYEIQRLKDLNKLDEDFWNMLLNYVLEIKGEDE